MSSGEFTKVPVLNKESIIVGSNLIRDFLPKDITVATPKTTKYVIITDTAVHSLHFGHLLQALHAAGISSDRIYPYTVPVGEQTKSREQKACIEDWMLGNECNRDTCIIALGGGVVGDLSGFVASTYLRGIPFIQIPTTLLAMVDSSIGGKTGINTTKAKNLIGAIYQPVRIYIDITFLQTLPKRQIANGMAEVIKTFAIRNEEMFSVLEESYDKVFDPAANQDVLYKIIVECVKIKAHVVTIDETEAGLRTLLNFGHTIGHAIESVCMEFMLHGECVAIGMVKEAEIARELGHLAPSAVARLASCIRAYSLPIAIPAQGSATEVLMEKMALDKKNVGGKKRCVLLTKIGATLNDVAQLVDDSILLKSISKPIVVIPPSSPIQGSIRVPGSKSISNRVLLLAAMGEGECRIGGLLHSDDTQVMMNALKLLGAAEFRYEKSQNPHDTEPVLVVKGNGGKMVAPPSGKHLYLGNAGTATRFLATLCTLVGVYAPSEKKDLQKVVLTGDKRMCERPIKDLVVALKQHQDCSIRYLGTDGCPPLEIDGTGLRGGKIELAADVSSQFVSSILLSSPYANTPVTLSLDPHKEVVSQPYIDMTVSLMRDFGVNVEVSADKRTYTIPKQPYKNPAIVDVESDASSSTYPLVFAAITGGKVTALNVTSKSLQGDAQFCRVLEKMGCTVSQDEHKTTVEGPAEGQLRGVDFNMGDLTDAFMGVACLAAVAKGTTRITGIANQRVKECNRIQVMVEELTKLGVKCRELEDGVEVEGMPLSAFKAGAIECYNDHRIAMSFACLGCKVPNITIKDKECVQKTYPEFWDDLTNAFGVKLTTPKIEAKAESAPQTGKPQRVIIIGMRGAGKTSQGRVAAGALGYPFVDLDEYFEKISEPNNIKTFVEQKGWDQFRLQELKVFQQALSEYEGKPVIISCGGGIVETEPARKVLLDLAKVKDTHIIFFQRHIDDIAEYLIEKDKVRPAFAEHPTTVYGRRFENYRRCSTHEFVINKGDEDWHAIEREFIDFVSQITGQETRKFVAPSASNVEHDLGSFFICLTFPDYLDSQKVSKKDVEVLSEGVHAIEFRADLLASPDGLNVELLGKQHAALRRKNTHRLPLIFTIRSVSHGGSFAGNEDTLFSLLEQGVRYGVEYLDVESTWSKSSLAKIVSLKEKNPSSFKIISSYHCYDPKIWEDDSKITAMFDLCYFSKSVDVVKVVVNATEANVHGTRIHRLADQWRERNPGVPTIVLCTGEKGKIARVLNRFLTPVTHPILPAKAAPGQMSVQEIHLARHSLGFIPKGNFYLFGSPISQSRSPLIHNTGFKILGLPHQYHICETLDVSEIQKKIRDPSTFGASVTIPHKLDVIPLVDKLSEHAKRIGAVNTIYKVPTKEGTWEVWGDNTDYLGVKGLLTARLGKEKPLNALVLGAGGTSRAVLYALNRMNAEGYRITKHLYNRSTDKARDLAAEFDCNVITTLESADETCPDLVISTLPPAAQNEIFSGDLGRFAWMFQKGQLALDLVYRPRETPVLKLAKSHNVKYLIEGIEVLLEQGYAQFCIWTGTRAAPTNEIREIVMASL